MMKPRTVLLIVLSAPSALLAQRTLVAWGGDYVRSSQPMYASYPHAPEQTGLRSPVMNDQPRQPSSGYEGPSGVFHANVLALPPTNVNLASVSDGGETDTLSTQMILARTAPPGPHTLSAQQVFHWKVESGEEEVSLQSLTLEARRTDATGVSVSGRWMVRVQGAWFLSDRTFEVGTQFESRGASMDELALWHPYSPRTSLDFRPGDPIPLPQGTPEAVGFHLLCLRPEASTPSHLLRVDIRWFAATSRGSAIPGRVAPSQNRE